MRVLIVSPYFPPQPAVASVAVHAMARIWATLGDQITILTTKKRPDQQGLAADTSGLLLQEIESTGPWAFERARSAVKSDGTPSKPGRVQAWVNSFRQRRGIFGSVRMPDLTDAWVKPAADWAIENGPWDVVFSSAGPYTAHLCARRITRAKSTALWAAEFRDLWTGNPVHRGLWPFTIIEQYLERGVLRQADLLVGPTPYCVDWLSAATNHNKPVTLCLNSAAKADFQELDPSPAFPQDGMIRIVHTGTVYPAIQDFRPLFEGWRSLRDQPGIDRLLLTTAGQNAEVWKQLATPFGLADRIEVRGPVARDEALRMQRDANALLIGEFVKGQQGALPGKVFEYLSGSAPILVINGKPTDGVAKIVGQARRGIHLPNAQACAKTLPAVCRNEWSEIPDSSFLATLTRESQVQTLVHQIRELSNTAH